MKSLKIQYLRNLIQFNRLGEIRQMAQVNRVDLVDNMKTFYDKVRNEYEDMFEMTSIKKHHEDLLKLETDLHQAADQRRSSQVDLNQIQESIQYIRDQILKTDRRADAYVELTVKENKLAKDEDRLRQFVKDAEQREKELFSIFSNKLKVSYQLDLIRQHKQRLFSLICTAFGAAITFIFAYFKSKTERTTFYESMLGRFGDLEDKVAKFDQKNESFLQSTTNQVDSILSYITMQSQKPKPAEPIVSKTDPTISDILFNPYVCIGLGIVVVISLIR